MCPAETAEPRGEYRSVDEGANSGAKVTCRKTFIGADSARTAQS
jgi:hypothetical protein